MIFNDVALLTVSWLGLAYGGGRVALSLADKMWYSTPKGRLAFSLAEATGDPISVWRIHWTDYAILILSAALVGSIYLV